MFTRRKCSSFIQLVVCHKTHCETTSPLCEASWRHGPQVQILHVETGNIDCLHLKILQKKHLTGFNFEQAFRQNIVLINVMFIPLSTSVSEFGKHRFEGL